jgi:hypothetical protein
MAESRIHLHSMLVHSVVALAALAAGSFVLAALGASFGRLGPGLWVALLRASLVGLLLCSLPAVVTGIADRDRAYATWHPSHRAKLVLSLLLVALVAIELAATLTGSGPITAWVGVGIAANMVVVLALAAYGLRITLGRQALARTSYVPDMKQRPPVDILALVAAAAAEEPKLIDPSEEDAA